MGELIGRGERPNAVRATKVLRYLCSLSLILSGCAHPPENFQPEIKAADQKCEAQGFMRMGAEVTCFSAVETPVVLKYFPFAREGFVKFDNRRRAAAMEFDLQTNEAYQALLVWSKERQAIIAAAVANEPALGNLNSQVSKDIFSAKVETICNFPSKAKTTNCAREIIQPIWKRDAPATYSYSDIFYGHLEKIGNEFDAGNRAPQFDRAREIYSVIVNQAASEFLASVRQTLQDQEEISQNEKAESRQRAAENLQAFAEFIGGVVVVTIGAAAIVASAALQSRADASQYQPVRIAPIRCQANTIGNYTYTNCN